MMLRVNKPRPSSVRALAGVHSSLYLFLLLCLLSAVPPSFSANSGRCVTVTTCYPELTEKATKAQILDLVELVGSKSNHSDFLSLRTHVQGLKIKIEELEAKADRNHPDHAQASLKPFGNSSYVSIHKGMTWGKAQTACHVLGGELASMDSPGEWAHVYKQLKAMDVCYHWLGGHLTDMGVWKWVSGKDLSTAEKPWKSISAGKCLLSECPNSPKQSIDDNWIAVQCDGSHPATPHLVAQRPAPRSPYLATKNMSKHTGVLLRTDWYPLCELPYLRG